MNIYYTKLVINLWVNMSHKSNICNKFILFFEMFFYIFNSLIEIKNDNFNYNKLIKDYEAINLDFS